MMKRRRRLTPKEITREDRFILTMAAVITLIIVIALYGYFTGRWDAPPV